MPGFVMIEQVVLAELTTLLECAVTSVPWTKSTAVLEAQGFYARPLLCSRVATLWQLLKTCVLMSLGLVLVLFFFKVEIARWIGCAKCFLDELRTFG